MKTEFADITLKTYRNKLVYLRRSDRTVNMYCYYFEQFLNKFDLRAVECTKQEIENYVVSLSCKTSSHQNTIINAIKFYYERVLEKDKDGYYNIERPKREFKIPDILTPDEVTLFMSNTKNIKHRTMLQVTYSCGLRNSEVRSIKLHHIDWKQSILKVVCGKGKRDRLVPIPDDTLELLKQYYIEYIHKKYNPNRLLFIGEKYEEYSSRSLQELVAQAMQRIKLQKHITPHSLRHSRATHLKNAGVDIKDIKDFLDHRDLRTTEIYLHIGIESRAEIIKRADALIKMKTAPVETDLLKLLTQFIQQNTNLNLQQPTPYNFAL